MIACKVLVLVLVAVTSEALPFRFTDEVPQYGRHPGSAGGDFGPRGAPPSPGTTEELSRWLRLIRPVSTAPSNYIQDRPGPSIYDDLRPQPSVQTALARTLWFDEFPHRRAVLNWQEKRRQQGLPLYQLLSQRPGFPFYQGN